MRASDSFRVPLSRRTLSLLILPHATVDLTIAITGSGGTRVYTYEYLYKPTFIVNIHVWNNCILLIHAWMSQHNYMNEHMNKWTWLVSIYTRFKSGGFVLLSYSLTSELNLMTMFAPLNV